jgi:cbb3-type cytochrome oxidase maturation protein
MDVLFLLIPLSVLLAAGFTVACLGSIRGGQYDDLESPPWRMLFDRSERSDRLTASRTPVTPMTPEIFKNAPESQRSELS